jgi:hypothetical protein
MRTPLAPFFYLGATHNTVATDEMIAALTPFIVMPVGAKFFGERLNSRARADGQPVNPASFSNTFDRLVANSGLPRIRLTICATPTQHSPYDSEPTRCCSESDWDTPRSRSPLTATRT